MQNELNDATSLAYEQSFSYRPALSQKLTASGSVHLYSSGSESMDSESGSSDDEDLEIDSGSDSSRNSQLRCFVATDYFSNE